MKTYSLMFYELVGEDSFIYLVDNDMINNIQDLRKDLNYVNGHFVNNTKNDLASNIIAWRGWFASDLEDIANYENQPEHKTEQFGIFNPFVIEQQEGRPFNWQDVPPNEVGIITHIYHFGFIL